MKNGYGQEIQWVLEEDMLAWLKETQTPEKYAELEARHKELRERIRELRERSAALQAKNAPEMTVRVRLESGQIVVDNAKKLIWPTEEEFCANAKEGLSPEELARMKEGYRKMREQYERGNKPISILTDSEGCVIGWAGPVTHSCHVAMPIEMITDPWTGKPKVFTEEEKAKFELTNRGWSPERRERVASFECKICNRLFGEHSWQELEDCTAQSEAPHHHLYPKGQRAKKETIAHGRCDICSRLFGDHSQQEYDACRIQHRKRNKPKQHRLRYVKCEICGDRFGDHSPEKFDACVDQLIENSV